MKSMCRRACLLVGLVSVLAACAPPAAGAVDPAKLADQIEAQAVALAAKFSLGGIGMREKPPTTSAGSVTVDLLFVPELLPALLEQIEREPALDLAGATVSYASSVSTVTGMDPQGKTRTLTQGHLRLAVPIASGGPRTAEAKARLDALRAVRRLSTSSRERFLAGEFWLLRDLRLEADGRLQLNAVASSPEKLIAGARSLTALDALRIKRVTSEPYVDRWVWSLEIQGVARPGGATAPPLSVAATEAALTLGDGWVRAHAGASETRASACESVRIESPVGDRAVPVDLNMSGAFAKLDQLPAILAASRMDAAHGQISVAMETKIIHVPEACQRMRLCINAEYLPPPATPGPPHYSSFIETCIKHLSSDPDAFVSGARPVLLRDLRIEGDGRIQMNLVARDEASLKAALAALGAHATLTIKRTTPEPYRTLKVVSAQLQGHLAH